MFVEKPLCLTLDELKDIEQTCVNNTDRILMVGFNRRFAPMVMKIKALLTGVPGPKALIITVNAGNIPSTHWIQDLKVGGGRIIGEACHYIDLLYYLVGAPVIRYYTCKLNEGVGDTVSIQFEFTDGSIGSIHYYANGSKSYPKERLEVFANGRVLKIDNFRKLTGYGWPNFSKLKLWRQDKGNKACVKAFVESVTSGATAPIPFNQLMEVSRLSLAIAESLRK